MQTKNFVSMVLAVVTILTIFPINTNAQSVSFGSAARHQYLAPDGIVFHNDAVIQSDIVVAFDSGLYGVLWHSVGTNDGDLWSDFGDEVNLVLGWGTTLSDNVYADVSLAYFEIVEDFDGLDGNILVGSAMIGVNTSITGFYTKVTTYRPSRGDTPGPGTLFRFGSAKTFELGRGFGLSADAAVTYDSGAFNTDNGLFLMGGLVLSKEVTENLVIFLDPIMSTPISSFDDGRETDVAWSSGFRYSF